HSARRYVPNFEAINGDPGRAVKPKATRAGASLIINCPTGTPRRACQMSTDDTNGVVGGISSVIRRVELHVGLVDCSALNIHGVAVRQPDPSRTAEAHRARQRRPGTAPREPVARS